MKDELEQPTNLCTVSGSLSPDAVGWSRRPLHRCNLSGHSFRKKRWNRWCVQTEKYFFAAAVADFDYSTTAFVSLVDLHRKTVIERSSVNLLGRQSLLGDCVDSTAAFRSKRITFSEAHEFSGTNTTTLLVTCDNFSQGDRLSAALRIVYPNDFETLGVVVPIDHSHFHYTSKHVGLPVAGRVRIGRREIPFEGPGAFATLDFGRGVWPRRTVWNWGAACGYGNDANFGINLGGKWTDNTGATENALTINGRLMKIHEDLEWTYDPGDFKKPWRVKAPLSGDVDLLFEPVVERAASIHAIVMRSKVNQVFGIWSGKVRDQQGRTLEIPSLSGWAEEHRALW